MTDRTLNIRSAVHDDLEAWQFNEAAQAWFVHQGFTTHSNTMMAVLGKD